MSDYVQNVTYNMPVVNKPMQLFGPNANRPLACYKNVVERWQYSLFMAAFRLYEHAAHTVERT
jgi:hypothetical protein